MIMYKFTFIFMISSWQLWSCFFLEVARSFLYHHLYSHVVRSLLVILRWLVSVRYDRHISTELCLIRDWSHFFAWLWHESCFFIFPLLVHLYRLDQRSFWSRLKKQYVHVLTRLSHNCALSLGRMSSLAPLAVTRLSSFLLSLSDNYLLLRPEIWSFILSSFSLLSPRNLFGT